MFILFVNRLVDLGDENITKLKSSEELSNEREEVQKEEIVLGEKIDMQDIDHLNNDKKTSSEEEKQLEYQSNHYERKWRRLIKVFFSISLSNISIYSNDR
jgi:seryl-tRNA synthetase